MAGGSRAAEAVRMTLTIVGNAVKAILSNETKVRVREREGVERNMEREKAEEKECRKEMPTNRESESE